MRTVRLLCVIVGLAVLALPNVAAGADSSPSGTLVVRLIWCGGYGGCGPEVGWVSVFDASGHRLLRQWVGPHRKGRVRAELVLGRYTVVCRAYGTVLSPRRVKRSVRVPAHTVTRMKCRYDI